MVLAGYQRIYTIKMTNQHDLQPTKPPSDRNHHKQPFFYPSVYSYPTVMLSAPSKEIYLVLSDTGMLGRNIVECLRDRGDPVSILDLVQRYDDILFYPGNIADEGVVFSVLQKVRHKMYMFGSR